MRVTDDEGTNHLLGQIAAKLSDVYALDRAEMLVREYYLKFTDAVYCASIGIPVQDDDFFFHEGVIGMALRVRYYVGLSGTPDPHKFIEWCASLNA